MLNETGKRILQVLQIVNNDQTRSDVVSRLKSIQEKINERIENEKFFELDRSTVKTFSLRLFDKEFLFLNRQDFLSQTNRSSLSDF